MDQLTPYLFGIATWIALFFLWPRLMLTVAIIGISLWLLWVLGYLS